QLRAPEQIDFTPAPDIFHEATGHAPILPDPIFASYLRRIGDLGRRAFAIPEEDRLHDAGLPEASEAARLSRLYWWTVEYGLVGRLDDFEIYGAGLLSSLGESGACQDPHIRKLPLDERCMDVAFDITRPQPRLYVAPSFEALHDLLDRAARKM